MTPAHQLLLALLRRDTTRESLPVFGSEAWHALRAVASRDLHPYLAWRLPLLLDPTRIPPEVLAPLVLARRGAAVGLLTRQTVLRRLTGALDEAGIPFVVLKGVALAHLAYPEPALRSMGDIDIWTRPCLLYTSDAADE